MEATGTSSEEAAFYTVLDAESRAALMRRGVPRQHRPGTVLLREGQVGAPVVILLDGRVRVSAVSSDGRELVLAFCGAGSILGELAALDHGRCSATVTAIEDLRALTLRPAEFYDFLRARPEAAIRLVRLLGQRLRDADRKRVEFAALDTAGRVAARMVELAERFGETRPDGSVVITLTLSQEELATWVGSSREAAVKAIGQLRGLGLLETGRRRFLVTDLAGLRERSVL